MKRLFTALIFSLCLHSAYSQIDLPDIRYTPLPSNQTATRNSYSLPPYATQSQQIPLPEIRYESLATVAENVWYEAIVRYHNPNTGTKETYTLNVKVFNDRIITISFGDNESVHTGHNNSGYTYSGGDLTFYQDRNGNITSANTRVIINQNGYKTLFDIEL